MRVCHKQTHSHLFYLAHTNNDGQQKKYASVHI